MKIPIQVFSSEICKIFKHICKRYDFFLQIHNNSWRLFFLILIQKHSFPFIISVSTFFFLIQECDAVVSWRIISHWNWLENKLKNDLNAIII